MLNKKNIFMIISILMATLLISGCANRNNLNEEEEKTYILEGHDFGIRLSGQWRQSFSENDSIDIQFTDNHAYLSILVYEKSTLPKGQTPQGLYNFHKEDLVLKRKNIKEVEDKHTRMVKGKTITTEYFTGELGDIKSGYYMNVVEFDKDSEEILFILFSAQPQDAEKRLSEWESIVDNIELVESSKTEDNK